MIEKKRRFSLSKKLQDGISETINLVENTDNQFRDADITLHRIELDPDNPRQLSITLDDVLAPSDFKEDFKKQKEFEQLKELAVTIESNGVLNPIVVYRFGEKYRIVAGERRFLASNLAKKHSIPARVYNNKPDDLQLKIVQWVENTAREDLSLSEKIHNIESIVKFYSEQFPNKKLDAQEVSRITGLSLTNTYRFFLLIRADERIKQLIESGKLNSMQMAEILASVRDRDTIELAINAFLDGKSPKEIQLIAKRNQKKVEKEWRDKITKRTSISFGTTKNLKVAEVIIKSIAYSPLCENLIDISSVDWSDAKGLEALLKRILKNIEDIV